MERDAMKFLNDADLRARGIKFSRQHRDRLIRAGKFPKPVKLGTGATGVNAWLEGEIEEYQKARIAERDAQLNKTEAA
jgi:predicted DNA-binding transcriptional regulator AlpA